MFLSASVGAHRAYCRRRKRLHIPKIWWGIHFRNITHFLLICPWSESISEICNFLWRFNFNGVQTRCIVKGEAQKSPLFWKFSGGVWFSQERLFSKSSTKKPLNLIKSPIFTNTPCKFNCLCNAPSLHIVDHFLQNAQLNYISDSWAN